MDFSHVLDFDDMSVCPFCDNAIVDYEPVRVIAAHGGFALAHDFCVLDALRDLEDDDDTMADDEGDGEE